MINDVLIKTAKLARLDISKNQEKILEELESILDYVQVVNKAEGDLDQNVNISGNYNVFKQDKVKASLSTKQILSNAPKSKNGYIEIEGIF